nr:pyrophosphate--fructose 6-phosphate 1-phosphotransferase subunit alpha [Tanacetum cinerariifolium]
MRVEFGDAIAAADPTGASEGFYAQETLDIIDDVLTTYKNQACKALNLDCLDIVGDTAQLAETFAKAKCATMVVRVPVTLNGDLKNQFVETNVGFYTICTYYYFIQIMGRKATHVAVECTLQSHPNMAFQMVYQRSLNSPWCMIRRDSKTMILLVLLAGGPSHAFTLQDSRQIEDDFKSLRDLFWANGDGFPWIRVTLKTYGSSAKSRFPLPATTGQWIPFDPNTLLPMLCCRNDDDASKIKYPFSTKVSIRSVETQFGAPISQLFVDISPEPMDPASLGQVFRAHLHTRELVVVKVQRPGICLKKSITFLRDRIMSGLLLYMVCVTDTSEVLQAYKYVWGNSIDTDLYVDWDLRQEKNEAFSKNNGDKATNSIPSQKVEKQVTVVKGITLSNVPLTPSLITPALVLDDSCAAIHDFVSDERVFWFHIKGVPLNVWSRETFLKIGKK